MTQREIEDFVEKEDRWFDIEEIADALGFERKDVEEKLRRLRKNKRVWIKTPRKNRQTSNPRLVAKHRSYDPNYH